ncbi:hypothetical protein [Serratia sp. M24T3]|uniref:hypothetical protein n=1 Tax=Serratia sp. M24T3 TaxID=932213 RepID=UPI0012F4F50B|nr:hypothetical protein [Serratia sp. M24T3]
MKKLIKLSAITITICSVFCGANALATHNSKALTSYPDEIAVIDSSAQPVAKTKLNLRPTVGRVQ